MIIYNLSPRLHYGTGDKLLIPQWSIKCPLNLMMEIRFFLTYREVGNTVFAGAKNCESPVKPISRALLSALKSRIQV